MVSRTTPFDELSQFFDLLSRQFNQATRSMDADDAFSQLPWTTPMTPVDLVEYDDRFDVMVDLPGFDHDDVELVLRNNRLRITATREEAYDDADAVGDAGRVLRHERRQQTVDRTIRIPELVDDEAIEAQMNNGVLAISLPKKEDEAVSHIEVQ